MARANQQDNLLDYITKLYAQEDELLASFKTDLPPQKFAIQVNAVEGKIIQVLLHLLSARKVLEVGTLAGYSSIWIARALPKDGMLYTIEKSAEHFKLANEKISSSDIADRVSLHHGAALEVLTELTQHGPFDAAFIDADKANYPNYLEAIYPMLRQGGLIIADNTRLFDLVLNDTPPEKNPELWEAMRRFNLALADDKRFISVMLPTSEGLSIAIKK